MAKTTKIQSNNWEIETNDATFGLKLTHSARAGNEKFPILFTDKEFPDLYNLIVAVAQVHPEWLTNTTI